ncbi:MAG: hypothetical protein AMXMBFR80_02910 [Dehalococcoidia bacterium]|nr:hypothetical protein [Tepidiformaceae bacterium]
MERRASAVLCAWCGALASGALPAEYISHGICADCAIGFLRRLPPAYLRSIAEPDGAVTLLSGHRLPLAPDGRPLD